METPQYFLTSLQRLPVAGHQLFGPHFFSPIPTTNTPPKPPFGGVHTPPLLLWEGKRPSGEGTATEETPSAHATPVAAQTPVDAIFRNSHKATGGSWEPLGAGRGDLSRQREVGEPPGRAGRPGPGLICFPGLAGSPARLTFHPRCQALGVVALLLPGVTPDRSILTSTCLIFFVVVVRCDN